MRGFVRSCILFSLPVAVPLAILMAIYIWLDPFKVIYTYDSLCAATEADLPYFTVGINQDYVSTNKFLRFHPDYQFNAFILGNSRSSFHLVKDWLPHLEGSRSPYHFFGAGEALWALHKRVLFLDRMQVDIKDVLLVLDHSVLVQEGPKKGHLFEISPVLLDYENRWHFQWTSFKAFIDPRFITAYLDLTITGVPKPYMFENYIIQEVFTTCNEVVNEPVLDYMERLIAEDRYYTAELMAQFYPRDTVEFVLPPLIGKGQSALLRDIAEVFRKHGTGLRVVLAPLYDQKRINDADIDSLRNIFGNHVVFNFSGINEITSDHLNYYENSHYRPHVSRAIMQMVYASPDSAQ